MTIAINGSGTITGISVGGLNDNIITKNEMATGGAWAPAGTVLQVVQSQYSTQVSNTTTSYVDSGLSASITPSSSTNKILVFIVQMFDTTRSANGTGNGVQLVRNSTIVYKPTYAGGSQFGFYTPTVENASVFTMSYLDSPSSSSSVTYKTQFATFDSNNSGVTYAQPGSTISNIILMEIAA